MPAPDKPSKGVRKLRDAEAKAGHQIVMERQKEMEEEEEELSNATAGGQYPPARRVSRALSKIPIESELIAGVALVRAFSRRHPDPSPAQNPQRA